MEARVLRLVRSMTGSSRAATAVASGSGGPAGLRAGGRAGRIGVDPRSMVAASGW